MSDTRRINHIVIDFTAATDQRYDTIGDWFYTEPDTLRIVVNAGPTQKLAWPIAIHELAEALLCKAAGISQAAVDEWDITGPGKDLDDPGAHTKAPYFNQHMQATQFEQLMLQFLDIDEAEYATYFGDDAGRLPAPKEIDQ